jgi:hypothetical protein
MSNRRHTESQGRNLQHYALLEEKDHRQQSQDRRADFCGVGVERFFYQAVPLIKQQDAKKQHGQSGGNDGRPKHQET